MFDLDKKHSAEKHSQKLKELTDKFERLEHIEDLLDNLLAENKVSPEEISAFLGNPNNFHGWAWDEMQTARAELNHKFDRDLKNIKNSHSTAEKYQTLKQAGQWLFVR